MHDDDCPRQSHDDAVCWLLDVRRYGLDRANLMHPAAGPAIP